MRFTFRFNVMMVLLVAIGLAVLFGPHSIAAAQFVLAHVQNIADPSSIAFGLGMGGMFIGDIAPFPTRPEYLAIKMSYRNPTLIADKIFPPVKVNKLEFQYTYFEKGDTFRIPDTFIGRKGKPNQVELKAHKATDTCEPYGLDYPVPQDDIEEAPLGYDPVAVGIAAIANWVALDREVRIAAIAFAAGTYGSPNKTALSGNHRWDVVHADADPIVDIMTGLDALLMRGNCMAIGRQAWSVLIRNSFILKAVNSLNGSGVGIATKQQIMDLFELQEINVGESFVNTAKKGATAAISRTWGKHCLLYYKDPAFANVNDGITFAWTGRKMEFAGSAPDKDIGPRGGIMARAGSYDADHVMAADLGYYIADVIS